MTQPEKTIVLTVAASDAAGMAGIQMDIKVLTAFGLHPICAITANTAQNNQRVVAINPVRVESLQSQLQALAHFPIQAIKVGLLADLTQAKLVAEFAKKHQLPMIYDPVLSASSGTKFIEPQLIPELSNIMLPNCQLVTPNIDEAAQITKMEINTLEEVEIAARKLHQMGAKQVLIKGGHFKGKLSQDYFYNEEKSFWLTSSRLNTVNSRGTGCALASAIAASIALGYSMIDAVVIGKMAINQGLRESYSLGNEKGPVEIRRFPDQQIDLPVISFSATSEMPNESYLPCNQPTIGLYPIVERADWLAKLAESGVTTAQLRIKDLAADELEAEIAKAVQLSQQFGIRLYINDYWQLAIKYQAYGVHLGQEDIDTADLSEIHSAGLRLGLSTHCHYEVARAVAINPSYIAVGPVYHTNTKQMPWVPHGIQGLVYWRNLLKFPLVAIGGLNQQSLPAVDKTGVDGIALITAITQAVNPQKATRDLVALMQS